MFANANPGSCIRGRAENTNGYKPDRGDAVSSQPAQEWDDMNVQQQTEIRDRLIAACNTKADASAYVLRQRLANASRPALAEALERL
jgi:hypothetical protein